MTSMIASMSCRGKFSPWVIKIIVWGIKPWEQKKSAVGPSNEKEEMHLGGGLNGSQSAEKPPGAVSSQRSKAGEGRLTISLQRTQIIPPFPAESDPRTHFSFSSTGDYWVWSTHWQVFGAGRVFIQYHKKPRRLWNGVWWEGTCSHFHSPHCWSQRLQSRSLPPAFSEVSDVLSGTITRESNRWPDGSSELE